MDAKTFDRLTTSVAHQRNRRAALRLLIAGTLAGLISPRLARAMQADRDGDGLYDDDEVQVYGTNPDVYDTDGDGAGDGEEVYLGSNPLAANSVAGVVGDGNDVSLGTTPVEGVDVGGDQGEAVACADEWVNCNGFCVDLLSDPYNCGFCGGSCGNGGVCSFGVCSDAALSGNGGVATCRGIGYACDYDTQCCGGNVFCCWDGVSLQTECTDVTPYGGRCPI